MYIGKLGDGTAADDGIYVLIKEAMDNSVDEYHDGSRARRSTITVGGRRPRVGARLRARHSARQASLDGGLGDEHRAVRYGSAAFKKIGRPERGRRQGRERAVERVQRSRSVRDGEARTVRFAAGIEEVSDIVGERRRLRPHRHERCRFVADRRAYSASTAYHLEYVETLIRSYTYLNAGPDDPASTGRAIRRQTACWTC